MDLLTLALVLFALGAVLGAAEIFIPSAGVLAMLSVASFVGSVICAFQVGTYWGVGLLVTAPVIMGVILVKGFSYLPKSWIGKKMILSSPANEPDAFSAGAGSESAGGGSTTGPAGEYQELVGQEGLARTPLRPSGYAQIGTRRVQVVTFGDFIAEGARIRVNKVEGNRVIVEAIV
ncbi:MAG: NfeD family protein [Phycisphaerae bacterium]